MKILLTGASGQLGRALQAQGAVHNGYQFVSFSHSQLDIASLASVKKCVEKVAPDVVINCAAYNFVDQAEDDRDAAFAVNERGPENLAKTTAALKIPLVHVSTDFVFDGQKKSPFVESDAPHPLGVYAQSKLAGEKAVLQHNSASYVVRTAWVYLMGGRNFLATLPTLTEKNDLKIVSDQFGSPTYAPHLARRILDLLDQRAAFGLYHMAGRGGASRFQFAVKFFDLMNINKVIVPISATLFPQKARRPDYSVLDTERGEIFRLPSWEQGVTDFVKDLKKQSREQGVSYHGM